MTTLSQVERSRYLRHLLVEEIGEAGQLRLKQTRVLCIGAGGLGSPALMYLAAAGVGHIGIVDPDVVDASNLQRQVLFDTTQVGAGKAETAAARLRAQNPHIEIVVHAERFDESNAERLLGGYDAILDGTDNFATRYLVNDAAIKLDKPNFFACIYKFTGQVAVFTATTGCYRCVFPTAPSDELAPDCATAGVLGVLPGIVGTYQALELLKWRLGIGESLTGKLLTIDTLANRFRTLSYDKQPDCVCCEPSKIQLRSYANVCAAPATDEISVRELEERLTAGADMLLLDVRAAVEHELGNIGGQLLSIDTLAADPEAARALLPRDPDREIVVYCRSGGRSARACTILRQLGFRRVVNVRGGVLAWRQEIDPTLRS